MREDWGLFDEELERARVAWLYFIGGQTQQEIAQRMNITRLKVNKIIGQVRESGRVQVNVSLPLTDCIELAERVSARYGLIESVVVPDLDDYIEQKRVIGEAAGWVASDLIEGRDMGVGIGSGRTLSFAVRSLRARPKSESWVVASSSPLSIPASCYTSQISPGDGDCFKGRGRQSRIATVSIRQSHEVGAQPPNGVETREMTQAAPRSAQETT